MRRYIDADDFRKNAYYADTDIDIGVYVAEHGYADVVEVVRCKDCKHTQITQDGTIICLMNSALWSVDDMHFCSYGERIEEE